MNCLEQSCIFVQNCFLLGEFVFGSTYIFSARASSRASLFNPVLSVRFLFGGSCYNVNSIDFTVAEFGFGAAIG